MTGPQRHLHLHTMTSLLSPLAPPFAPYPSILNKPTHLYKIRDGTCAVAVPKLHGSNIQFTVWKSPCGSVEVRAGRRNGYIEPGSDHYGHGLAVVTQGIEERIRRLFTLLADSEQTDGPGPGPVMRLYGEVYGGVYEHPDVPAPTHGRKPVQKFVNYSPHIRLAFFDLCLSPFEWATSNVDEDETEDKDEDKDKDTDKDGEKTRKEKEEGVKWFSFDDASTLCCRVDLPWIPAAFRGTVVDTVAWARTHAADDAMAHWNPEGLPPLTLNAGEGFVVRTVGDIRHMVKIKNPRFEEIAVIGQEARTVTKPSVDSSKLDATSIHRMAGLEFAARYILATRVASVASKTSSDELDTALSKKGPILRALALALLVDALEDAKQRVDPLATLIVQGSAGYQVAMSAAFATMAAFVKSR